MNGAAKVRGCAIFDLLQVHTSQNGGASIGLTLIGKENTHVDPDYRVDIAFWRRWRVLRP